MSKTGVTVLRELEKDGNAVHIEGLDVTLDVNNQLIVLIQMLPLLLTKLSCLPLVPEFTEVKGLTREQATMVQELNAQLIYAHGITQKYITQQYFVLVCIQKMMKEVISNIPETDMTHLLDYIRNYNELKHDKRNFQKGGLPNPFMKSLVYLFSIVSLFAPSASASDPNTAVSFAGLPDDFTRGIIHFNKDTFQKELEQLSATQSDETDINTMVATVDAETNEKLKTIFGFISNILATSATGRQQLEKIISDFNEDIHDIAMNATETCKSLMSLASQNGIFDSEHFTSIKEINEVKEQIESVEEELKKRQDTQKISTVSNFLKGTFTTIVAPFTGDFATSIINIYDGVDFIYEFFDNTDDTPEQKAIAALHQKRKSLTYKENMAFNENLYQLSRLYCLNSYNLKIRLNSTFNTIELIGDKISYIEMISFITTVEKNIADKINKLSGDNTDFVKLALESLQERLYVLKEISAYLSNIIGESKTTINAMNTMNTKKNPLNKFEAYFKSKLDELRTLLTEAMSTFPLTERMNKATKTQLNAKLNNLKNEEDMMQVHHDIVKIRNMQDLLKSVSPALESFESIAGIIAKFVEVGTEGVAGVALAAPKGAVKASANTLSELVQELVPTSVLYGMGVFMILSIMSISGQIIMFTQSGQLMLAVVTFPFVCVYKLVVTPIGYVCTLVGSLCVRASHRIRSYGRKNELAVNSSPPTSSDNALAVRSSPSDDEGALVVRSPSEDQGALTVRSPTNLDNALALRSPPNEVEGEDVVQGNELALVPKTGGKRRKHTRKHKITKTKKARRGKRRQTHYKKRRPTKRH